MMYLRYIDAANADFMGVTAMAVSQDTTKIAVYITNVQDNKYYGNTGWLLVLNSSDGSYANSKVVTIDWGSQTDQGRVVVRSAGMYFDAYERVYLAGNAVDDKGRDNVDGTRTNYEAKHAIFAYEYATSTVAYFMELQNAFGRSAALAYKDAGFGFVNLFVGGSYDRCYTAANGYASTCFSLSITKLNWDGSVASSFQFDTGTPEATKGDHPYIDTMRIQDTTDPKWLYGTTRGTNEADPQRKVFFWRVLIDDNYEVVQNVQARMTQVDELDNDSFVSGLGNYDGTTLQTIFHMGNRIIYYSTYRFDQNNELDLVEIQLNIDNKEHGEAVWIGSNTQTKNGMLFEEAYIAVGTRQFETVNESNNFGKVAGFVIPTIYDNQSTCTKLYENLRNVKLIDNDVTHYSELSIYGNCLLDGCGPRFDTTVQIRDVQLINLEKLIDCNNYPTVNTVSGGTINRVNDQICGYGDSVTREWAFVPFQITSPVCTDTDPIFKYELVYDDITVDPRIFYLSVDPINNVIRVTLLPSPATTTEGATSVYTVKAYLPNGQNFSFQFTLLITQCQSQIITPSSAIDQIYGVTFPYFEYAVAPFTSNVDIALCPIEYTNQILPTNTWITGVSDFGGLGLTVGWQTNDDLNAGLYQITLRGQGKCEQSPIEVPYQLDVQPICKAFPIQIDTPGVLFLFPSQIVNVYQPTSQFAWDNSAVSSPDYINCAPIDWTLEMFDGTVWGPLDPLVFSNIILSNTGCSFDIQTNDPLKEGLYDLRASATFVNFPTNTNTAEFQIEVQNTCEFFPSFSLPASIVTDQVYTLVSTPLTPLFDEFVTNPAYCNIPQYIIDVVPAPSDPLAIVLTSKRQFKIESSDPNMLGTFQVQVFIALPSGLDSGVLGFSFNVEFRDPCLDVTHTIDPQIMGSPIVYTVSTVQSPKLIDNSLTFVTPSISYPFCPTNFDFEITNLDGSPIAAIFTYDPLALSFDVFTNDQSYVGQTIDMLIRAKFVDDLSVYQYAGQTTFRVQFGNPCIDDAVLTPAASQNNPADYFYDLTPKVEFNFTPFIVVPSFCVPQHSCQVINQPAGQTLDICNINLGSTLGIFDQTTGNYEFQTADMTQFAPGVYLFQITGTIGTSTSTASFEMTLVDPCNISTLSLNTESFVDSDYVLRSPEQTQTWDFTTLVTKNTQVDCGPYQIRFYQDDGLQTPLDALLFSVDNVLQKFKVLYNENVLSRGNYPILYEISYVNYSDPFFEKPSPFVISVLDPCDAPLGLTPEPIFDYEYTLTDNPSPPYYINPSTPDPAWCRVLYGYTITSSAGSQVVTFNNNPVDLFFTFSSATLTNLLLSGPAFQNYIVTVRSLTGNINRVEAQETFILKLKNPCIDPAFVQLQNQPIPNQNYLLYTNEPGLTWQFTPFTVVTQPIAHTFCGNLSYLAKFDGIPIFGFSSPLKYSDAIKEFSLYSEEVFRIGNTYPYSVQAQFLNYPGTTLSPVSTGFIAFVDPCPTPESVVGATQTDPDIYYYTGSSPKASFTLTPFVVDPPICTDVTYTCAMISQPNGNTFDLCNYNDGAAIGTFDSLTGNYEFSSETKDIIVVGLYVFEITATVGDTSASIQFTLNMGDPCGGVTLVQTSDPFIDQTYTLRDPNLDQIFQFSTFVQISTNVDCGEFGISFFYDDAAQTPIDTNIFQYIFSFGLQQSFTTLSTQDVLKVGVYNIRYKLFLATYTNVEITSLDSFTITIVDPCDNPDLINAPSLGDLKYTLTDFQKFYTVPQYTSVPDWCQIIYTYAISPIAGDALIQNWDPLTITFDIFNDSDITLSGINYTVEIFGTIGNVNQIVAQTSFLLKVQNPCLDPLFVQFGSIFLQNQVYELYEFDPLGKQWTHNAVPVTYNPVDHNLCGPIFYSVTFNFAPVTLISQPLAYDESVNQFSLYSQDFNLLAPPALPYSIKAFFLNYPSGQQSSASGLIEFIDPCPDPELVNSDPQTDPNQYFYTADTPLAQFTLIPFFVEPPVCIFTYNCAVLSQPAGQTFDLCNFDDGQSVGAFDPITGNFSFKSIDIAKFAPGDYVFEVTGTVGTKSSSEIFTLTLVNPCFTATLSIVNNPFSDKTYVLRDPEQIQPWDYSLLVQKSCLPDCGPYKIEFFLNDGLETPLDPTLFQSNLATNEFKTLLSQDVSKTGSYSISFKINFTNVVYSLPEARPLNPFTIEIVDPCKDPASFTVVQTNSIQEYTITDNPNIFIAPAFSISPIWCDIAYGYFVTDDLGNQSSLATVVTFDALTSIFTFSNVSELALSGLSQRVYQVSVTGDAGYGSTKQRQIFNFDLILKNPCIDPTFVSIQQFGVPNQSYTLFEFPLDPLTGNYGFEWQHITFSLITQPIVHSLCGQISYEIRLNAGSLASVSSNPLRYFKNTRTMNFYSEDYSLIGFHTISIESFLETYPSLRSLPAQKIEFQLEIINPCIDPNGIVAKPQQDPDAYVYSISPTIFTLNQFDSIPPGCPITYDCIGVTSATSDPISPNVQCNIPGVSFFDGIIDGDQTDGQFQFQTVDNAIYPPGEYKFTIRGSVGSNTILSDTVTFVLSILDPCPNVPLILIQDPLPAFTRHALRDDLKLYRYALPNIVNVDTAFNCGPLVVEYSVQKNEESIVIDPNLFVYQTFPASQGAEVFFEIKYIEEEKFVGEYIFSYRIFLEDYPSQNLVRTNSIQIEVYNPCEEKIPKPIWCPTDFIDTKIQTVITPDWMLALEDQFIEIGSNDLLYLMGDPISAYDDPMTVEMQFLGQIQQFAKYDETRNALVVSQERLNRNHVGIWTITVRASYKDRKQVQVVERQFTLTVIDSQIVPPITDQEEIGEPVNVLIKQDYDQEFAENISEAIEESSGKSDDQPVPYIINLSQTGQLTIGWTKEMIPPTNITEIEPAQIAVKYKQNPEEQGENISGRRMLQESSQFIRDIAFEKRYPSGSLVNMRDRNSLNWEKYLIYDALEIQMLPIYADVVDEEQTEIWWELISFDESFLRVQIFFKNPLLTQVSLIDKEYQLNLKVTFWNPKFFKDRADLMVEYGKVLSWPVIRQLDQSEAKSVQKALDWTQGLLLDPTVLLFFILLAAQGPLLPTWMFVNSMQLFTHVPMLRSEIPPNVSYFLTQHLNFIRMHFEGIYKILDKIFVLEQKSEYESLTDEATKTTQLDIFNSIILDSGYKYDFVYNMMPLLILIIAIVAIFSAIIVANIYREYKRSGQIDFVEGLKFGEQMTNFIVRFIYEAFFEIILCAMLYLSANNFSEKLTDPGLWFVCFFLGFLVLISFIFLGSLFFLRGPYQQGFYEKDSLKKSYWNIRDLSKEKQKSFQLFAKECIEEENQCHIRELYEQELIKLSTHRRTFEEERTILQQTQLDLKNLKKEKSRSKTKEKKRKSSKSRKRTKKEKDEFVIDNVKDSNLDKELHLKRKKQRKELRKKRKDIDVKDQLTSETPMLISSQAKQQFINNFQQFEGGQAEIYAETNQDVLDTERGFFDNEKVQKFQLNKNDDNLTKIVPGQNKFCFYKVPQKHLNALDLPNLMREAKFRTKNEFMTPVNQHYKTLFYGLRRNTEHNAGLQHPLIFLIRRIIFTMLILLGTQVPFLAITALLGVSVGVTIFTMTEKQWEDPLINAQHLVNEIALYALLVFVALFTGPPISESAANNLGWLMIGLVLVTITFNVAVILWYGIRFLKDSFRHCYRKKGRYHSKWRILWAKIHETVRRVKQWGSRFAILVTISCWIQQKWQIVKNWTKQQVYLQRFAAWVQSLRLYQQMIHFLHQLWVEDQYKQEILVSDQKQQLPVKRRSEDEIVKEHPDYIDLALNRMIQINGENNDSQKITEHKNEKNLTIFPIQQSVKSSNEIEVIPKNQISLVKEVDQENNMQQKGFDEIQLDNHDHDILLLNNKNVKRASNKKTSVIAEKFDLPESDQESQDEKSPSVQVFSESPNFGEASQVQKLENSLAQQKLPIYKSLRQSKRNSFKDSSQPLTFANKKESDVNSSIKKHSVANNLNKLEKEAKSPSSHFIDMISDSQNEVSRDLESRVENIDPRKASGLGNQFLGMDPSSRKRLDQKQVINNESESSDRQPPKKNKFLHKYKTMELQEHSDLDNRQDSLKLVTSAEVAKGLNTKQKSFIQKKCSIDKTLSNVSPIRQIMTINDINLSNSSILSDLSQREKCYFEPDSLNVSARIAIPDTEVKITEQQVDHDVQRFETREDVSDHKEKLSKNFRKKIDKNRNHQNYRLDRDRNENEEIGQDQFDSPGQPGSGINEIQQKLGHQSNIHFENSTDESPVLVDSKSLILKNKTVRNQDISRKLLTQNQQLSKDSQKSINDRNSQENEGSRFEFSLPRIQRQYSQEIPEKKVKVLQQSETMQVDQQKFSNMFSPNIMPNFVQNQVLTQSKVLEPKTVRYQHSDQNLDYFRSDQKFQRGIEEAVEDLQQHQLLQRRRDMQIGKGQRNLPMMPLTSSHLGKSYDLQKLPQNLHENKKGRDFLKNQHLTHQNLEGSHEGSPDLRRAYLIQTGSRSISKESADSTARQIYRGNLVHADVLLRQQTVPNMAELNKNGHINRNLMRKIDSLPLNRNIALSSSKIDQLHSKLQKQPFSGHQTKERANIMRQLTLQRSNRNSNRNILEGLHDRRNNTLISQMSHSPKKQKHLFTQTMLSHDFSQKDGILPCESVEQRNNNGGQLSQLQQKKVDIFDSLRPLIEEQQRLKEFQTQTHTIRQSSLASVDRDRRRQKHRERKHQNDQSMLQASDCSN